MKFTDNALKSRFLSACEGVTSGIVVIKTPEGETHRFGSSGEEAVLEIHDWAVVSAMAARGQIGLGETYVHGLWDTPSIESIIRVGLANRDTFSDFDDATWLNSLKYQIIDRVVRANSKSGSQKNIYAHYDVGNEFYQLWLDETMMYSSGIYNDPGDDLTATQYRKNDRALSRLTDKEGILEIGCGWGGFAERAADQGRHVTGITVSKAQRSYADARLDGR
ncbi:MAG: class I SAM-dependent methyltransferase, partial [Proteobacteria bacterium]